MARRPRRSPPLLDRGRFDQADRANPGNPGRLRLRQGQAHHALERPRQKTSGAKPIRLSYAEQQTGPWTTIADKQPNNGRHVWRMPELLPVLRSTSRSKPSIWPATSARRSRWSCVKVDLSLPKSATPGDWTGARSNVNCETAPSPVQFLTAFCHFHPSRRGAFDVAINSQLELEMPESLKRFRLPERRQPPPAESSCSIGRAARQAIGIRAGAKQRDWSIWPRC